MLPRSTPKQNVVHRLRFEHLENRINLSCSLDSPAVAPNDGDAASAVGSGKDLGDTSICDLALGGLTGDVKMEMIGFNELDPSDQSAVSFDSCWGCVGIDSEGLIYMAVGNEAGKGADDPADVDQ